MERWFRRKKLAATEPESPKVKEIVRLGSEAVRESGFFKNERSLSREESLIAEQAAATVSRFLRKISFVEYADRPNRAFAEGRILAYDHMLGESPEEAVPFYHPLEKKIRIPSSSFVERVHETRHDMVHEIFHLASDTSDLRNTRFIEKTGRQYVSGSSSGFARRSQEVETGDVLGYTKKRFEGLNEGMTEILAGLAERAENHEEYHYTLDYALYRSVTLLMVEGIARSYLKNESRREWERAYELAFDEITRSYLGNTFAFGKRVDTVFGPGTFRKIAAMDIANIENMAELAAGMEFSLGIEMSEEQNKKLYLEGDLGPINRIDGWLHSVVDKKARKQRK